MYNIVVYNYSKIYKIEEIFIDVDFTSFYIRSTFNNIVRTTKEYKMYCVEYKMYFYFIIDIIL